MALLSRLKGLFAWYEWVAIGGVLVIAFLAWYFYQSLQTTQEELTLSEQALDGARQAFEQQRASQEIDREVVSAWIGARDQRRQEQADKREELIDDYLVLAEAVNNTPDDGRDTASDAATDATSTVESAPTSDSDTAVRERVGVVADGMRDAYCRAAPDPTDCPAGESD